MKTLLLISPKNRTVYNFRGDLIRRVKRLGYRVVVTGPNADDLARVRELGVEFREVPMQKNGTNPLADLAYERALAQLCRAVRPDAALAYTVKPIVYGVPAARRAGVPRVFAMVTGVGYGFTATSPKARAVGAAMSALYRRALRQADATIFQNPDNLELFVRRGLADPGACHVVSGSGVNLSRFAPAPLPEGPSFLMLSRLLYSKGVREYLEAARMVKGRHPQARFALLGKPETMPDALSEAELRPYLEAGVVELLPERDDVRPAYAACNVYVLPSYAEGVPRTALEAMAMGRPVVTCDAPGCREVVRDGETGFLVPPRDAAAVAEAMERFVADPALAARMGAAGLAYARERFDVEKVNDEMVRIMGLEQDVA